MNLLDNLLEFTDRMVNHAEKEEWDEVISLQAERQRLYEAFESAYRDNPSSFKPESLMQLKDKNDRLIELSASLRDQSKSALQKLRGQKKAASAYQQKI